MARHREHIHRLRYNRLIPMLLHKRQITCQGRRIAGHINNALRLHLGNRCQHLLLAARTRRIHYQNVRTHAARKASRIADLTSIHERPKEVEDRTIPGHWEGDLIKGAGNKSAVGVLVERATRLVLLCKMADSTAESALAAFSAKLNSIAAPLRQTLTYDQGKEMVRHKELSQATGMRVYFCDPHSPWQKGSCENTNGLLRQFLPKGTDLSVHDQDALDSIADLMNNRPRQTLGWDSPYQVFMRLMQAIDEKSSATIH